MIQRVVKLCRVSKTMWFVHCQPWEHLAMLVPQSVFARLVYLGTDSRSSNKERTYVSWMMTMAINFPGRPWEHLAVLGK